MEDIDLEDHWEHWEQEGKEVYRLKAEESEVTLYFEESSFRIVVDVKDSGLVIKTPSIDYTKIYTSNEGRERESINYVMQDNSTIVRIRDEVISRKMG